MVDFEISDREKQTFVPPNRLLTLLEQAVSHQIESSRYKTKIPPRITNLLHDYVCPIIPNSVLNTFSGHTANVKCAEFVGSLGTSIISGSSDNTVRIWNTETGDLQGVLTGHKSRIWAVDSTNSGEFIASGSGDGSVKIWSSETQKLVSTLDGGGADTGDVYTVKYHPTGVHFC